MKNFNLRWECYDSRDDYSSGQKNKEKSKLHGSWEMEKYEMADEMGEYGDDLYNQNNNEEDPAMYYETGNSNHQRLELEIELTKGSAQDIGLRQTIEINITEQFQDFQAPIATATSWANTIKDIHKSTLNEQKIDNEDLVLKEREGKFTRWNEVIIEDGSYLNKNFQALLDEDQQVIEHVVKEKLLNKEQERAFRIIANHATVGNISPLSMYIGGMGGTGKSRVIHALRLFFQLRKESHRITICAPTGTAAALLQGSTYHSVLGFSQHNNEDISLDEDSGLKRSKQNLEGVDYILIDECSMLSLNDLFLISERLSKTRQRHDSPFGAFNIIFAGDFAQLPPVGGFPLYHPLLNLKGHTRMTRNMQKSAMARALWHQVLTVVILRENMRQKTQSPKDAQLRQTLEHMRYAACTKDDIEYLQSITVNIARKIPKGFTNVSVISPKNSQRDAFNEIMQDSFAKETNQQLHYFHSVDSWGALDDPAKTSRRNKLKQSHKKHMIMSESMKQMLWNIRRGSSKSIPGILPLCIGIPV
jgi:hypothetical protein